MQEIKEKLRRNKKVEAVGLTAKKQEECAGNRLVEFCTRAVLVLGLMIFFALTYYSLRYTELFIDGTEIMRTHRDSVWGNL